MAIPQDMVSAQPSKDIGYSDAVAVVVATPFSVCDAIVAGTGGTATVTMRSGASVTIPITAGVIYPIQITNVSAVVTTANIVALYK